MINDVTDSDSNGAQEEVNNNEKADYFFELGKYYYELALVQFDVEDQHGATASCKMANDFLNKSLILSNNVQKEGIKEYLSELKVLIDQNNKQQTLMFVRKVLPGSAAITEANSTQEHYEETNGLVQPMVVDQLQDDVNYNRQASSMHQVETQLESVSLESKEQSCNSQLSVRQLTESFDSLSLCTIDEEQDALVEDAKVAVTARSRRSGIMDLLHPLDSAWDEDQKLFTDVNRKRFYINDDATISLIDLEPEDVNFKFVLDLFNYSKHQSQKQGLLDFSRVKIKRICLINNPHYQEQFEKEIYLLSQRKGNAVFAPKWSNMSMSSIRTRVAKMFREQAAKYSDERLDFLPIWHGSSLDSLASILKTGFANLATTDLGYYGKGIYGTTSAEYAKRVYSGGYNADGILLLNWIGINSALMVAGMGDLELLKGRGNYANYDAHFIPVVPRNQYMHKLGQEDVYFPLQLERDTPVYNEIVVFGRQILARYVVYTECEPVAPANSLKFDMDLRRLSVEEALDRDRLLQNISHNPWIAINYSLLSQLLKNNETVKLPKKAEDHVIARLRSHLLPHQNNEKYDAISLCQIALYLDENCVSAYYNLANALRKKLTPARKAFLAFPIDQYYSPQELYQAALQRYTLKSSLTQPFVEKVSRSRCLAKLAQNIPDRTIAKEKALEAISVAHKDPVAWIALGTTLLSNESILIPNSGDPKCFESFNAKEIFKEALKLSPKSAEALLGLAKLVQPGEERVEINGKILNFQELLIMALDTELDDLEIIEELFNLYNKQQAPCIEIQHRLIKLLTEIWQYYNDCSKVWELLSYCLNPHEIVNLGGDNYTHKQLIEEAFRLDPANMKLYKMLLAEGATINFDFLVQKMQGNYNVACKKIQQELDLYVPVLASAIDPSYGQVSEEQLLPLEKYVQEYIATPNSQILWIQGYTGSGKTLFARHLEKVLWEQYPHTKQIPLLISWGGDFLKNALQEQGFEAKEIEVFEKSVKERGIKLILIIDNYHEEGQDLSLATDQRCIILSQQHPLPKIINYYYLVPFIDEQIRKYLYNYVQNPSYNKCNWSINRYEYALGYFQVRDLCKDQFLLKLVLQIIPEFLSFSKNADQKELVTSKIGLQKLTRFKVYEEFIRVWIEQKLKLSKHYKKYKDSIELDVLKDKFMEFSQDLAWELLIRQQHELVWNSEDKLDPSLGRFFESLIKKQRRILKICHDVVPIVFKEQNSEQSIYSCSFVHSTFRDYFAAKKIVEELKKFSTGSGITTLNYSILAEKNIRSFVVEQIEKEAKLQDQLIKIIDLSKSAELWSVAAANAITILNQAGMSFAGLDFAAIKVPNADLSGAQLDHTKLANANLAKVRLKGAWLYGAKLNGSNMLGAYFGEKPYKQIEQAVNCYAYSAGHEYFAEVQNKKLTIYKVDFEANTMESCKTLFITDNVIVSLTFSVDCKWLALVNSDGKITVLDLLRSNEPVILTGNHIAFSRDSKYLTFVSNNNVISIYNLSGHRENKFVTEHTGAICSISFSPDGKNLVSGGDDRSVYIYDIKGKTSTKIGMHNIGCVRNVYYSADLKWLGSCGDDRIIYLWHLTEFSNNKTLQGHSNRVNSIAFNEDLQILASGSDDKTIRIWNLTKFTCMQILTGHTDCVYNVLFTKDNRWLTSSSKDRTIRTWDLTDRSYNSSSGRKSATWHNNYVYSVAFSPDEQWLASGSRDNTVRLWRVQSFKNNKILDDHSELVLEDPKDLIYSVMFSLDGKWLAAGGNDGLYLYSTKSFMGIEGSIDLDKSEILVKYFNHPGTRSVAFSSNNQLLAAGSKDKKVRIFNLTDLTTNNASKVLEGHEEEVYTVAFSYDGNWLASGGRDHKVFMWDVRDWVNAVVYKSFADHSDCVDSIAFSLDHNWLASASWDQAIYIYDLKQLDQRQKLEDHTKEVNNIAFSRDSQYLFSGDYSGVLMIWHLCGVGNNLWKNVLKLRTGFNIFCVAYSNSSKFIATGGSDCSVRVWVHDNDQLTLLNTTHQSILCAEQLDITNAKLSSNSKRLLEQRGAFGEAMIDDLIVEEHDVVTLSRPEMLLFSNSFSEDKKLIAEESSQAEQTVNFNHSLNLINI